ncbi:MAG: hypothetical protein CML94_00795 [Rhodobiaceae bacterium]|nr:hypothetical protein [Rhodobiaceae bacterium]|tara:strand:- start:78 stop:2105 length:2028 start_codon:yes stop_codon:yes gene_type:complete
MKKKLILFFIIFIFPIFVNAKLASVDTSHAKIELLVETNEIVVNEDFIIGIKFEIEPGWHIYWKNPGDSGLPAEIQWKNAGSIEFKKLLWPSPQKTPEEPLMTYGYYDEVVLPAIFSVDSAYIKNGPSIFEIDFLICEKICIPEKAVIDFDLSSYSKEDIQFSREILSSWYSELPINFDRKLFVEASDNYLSIEWENKNNDITQAYFFPENKGLIKYSSKQDFYNLENSTKLIVERPIKYSNNAQNAIGVLEIQFAKTKQTFQIDQSISYVDRIEIPGTSNLSFAVAIILAFFGGIILNIMPCVFPVIALKVMSFVRESSEKNAWRHGLVFGLGVELSMLALLSLTFIFRNLGQAVGWGWQLQSSVVSTLLSLLFFSIAFILLFKVEIGTSFTKLGNLGSKSTGYLNSLLLGCLTVIVATPCTGPFMGAAIGWGLSQPLHVSSFIFLSLGFGVAFPTMFLSLIPSSLILLPKPGEWMVKVGQVMSIPMLLTAIWLAWVVQRQSGFIGLRDLLIALLLIITSLSIYKMNHLRIINRFLSFSAAILGVFYIIFSYDAERISTPKELIIGESWETAKVNQYRSEGKNVLVNFTADWCLTCKVNEAVVFNSKFFKESVSNGNIIYLVADWTNYDPKITEELEKYKRGGVPLYLYWKKDTKNPKILPAILSKQIFNEYTR